MKRKWIEKKEGNWRKEQKEIINKYIKMERRKERRVNEGNWRKKKRRKKMKIKDSNMKRKMDEKKKETERRKKGRNELIKRWKSE